jgi:hypothetical protein
LMMIWEQNDWMMLNSFSTSCRHKRDAIFRDVITGDETWVHLDIQPVTIWLLIIQNCHSESKGQLQAKNAYKSFSVEFRGSHIIAGSKKIEH